MWWQGMRQPGGYGGYNNNAARVREMRKSRIADLWYEHEKLDNEEQRAPLSDPDAQALWMVIDVMGGYARQRERRRREIDAELLLAHYGYRLEPSDGIGPDGHHVKLWTIGRTRYAGVVSAYLYREQLPEAGEWPLILYRWNNAQQHVGCSRCGEPLLQEVDSSLALKLMQNSTNTIYRVNEEGFLDPMVEDRSMDAIRYVYRTVEDGPASQPLDACPYCHQWLTPGKEWVREIVVSNEPPRRRREKRGL